MVFTQDRPSLLLAVPLSATVIQSAALVFVDVSLGVLKLLLIFLLFIRLVFHCAKTLCYEAT